MVPTQTLTGLAASALSCRVAGTTASNASASVRPPLRCTRRRDWNNHRRCGQPGSDAVRVGRHRSPAPTSEPTIRPMAPPTSVCAQSRPERSTPLRPRASTRPSAGEPEAGPHQRRRRKAVAPTGQQHRARRGRGCSSWRGRGARATLTVRSLQLYAYSSEPRRTSPAEVPAYWDVERGVQAREVRRC